MATATVRAAIKKPPKGPWTRTRRLAEEGDHVRMELASLRAPRRAGWTQKQASAYLRDWRAPSAPQEAAKLIDWALSGQEAADRRLEQTVLGLMLRLGDGNAVVLALRAWYPDFMTLLGAALQSRSYSLPPVAESVKMPHGGLIRTLVKSYASAGDLDQALVVARFWSHMVRGTPWAGDPAPHLAILHSLSRQRHHSTHDIAAAVLDDLRSSTPSLETYAVAGLLDLRLRCRRLFRDPHPVETWSAMRTIFTWWLQTFLAHRPPRLPFTKTDASDGSLVQRLELAPSWRIRPDGRMFALLFRALSKAHDARLRARGPSDPDQHRQLFAQMLVLQRQADGQKDLSIDQADPGLSIHDIETPANLAAAFECFLVGRDHAGAAVVLERCRTKQAPLERLLDSASRLLPDRPNDFDSLLGSLRRCIPEEDRWARGQAAVQAEIEREARSVAAAFDGPTYSSETLGMFPTAMLLRLPELLLQLFCGRKHRRVFIECCRRACGPPHKAVHRPADDDGEVPLRPRRQQCTLVGQPVGPLVACDARVARDLDKVDAALARRLAPGEERAEVLEHVLVRDQVAAFGPPDAVGTGSTVPVLHPLLDA